MKLRTRLIEIETEKTKDLDFKGRLCYILSRFDFMIFVFVMTCLFVVVTGIQFWMTNYLITVMGASQSDAYTMFFVAGAGGPVLGIVLCAVIFDRVGGYMSEHAVPICFTVGTMGMIAGIGSIFIKSSPWALVMVMMVELFCGAFMMPAVTGIMLNHVPMDMRTMANSVANFSYNLLGYLPAPLIYGYFYKKGGEGTSHLGLFSI